MAITRYDLTEDVATGVVNITPVPERMEGRYVAYEDYIAEIDALGRRPSLEDFIQHCDAVSKITGSTFKDARAEFFADMKQQVMAFLRGDAVKGA